MKTARQPQSVEAYYRAVVGPGTEKKQTEEVMAVILRLYPCTARRVAEWFRDRNPLHPLAQEARVSARVNWLKRLRINGQPVLQQPPFTEEIVDEVTHQKALLLIPTLPARQMGLFEEIDIGRAA